MAAPSATIRIYAQFPKDLNPSTDLNLDPTNWVWARCLAFPINKLNDLTFSPKPYKWICYTTGVVVGAYGHLHAQPDSSAVVIDYDSGLSVTSQDLYYHTTDGEKRCMFPVDPNIANANVTSSDTGAPCRDLFRQEVKMCDVSCVVLGSPVSICDVAHILPHMKGDQV